MNDILPPDSARWEWFEGKVRALMARYGYANVRTPIVEPTALFVRGLGEVTDIVEKEMYSFEDAMNGDRLTLRPEATAGIVRAMVEHNALYNGPLRVWSNVSLFRHERPQKGRYRQFHQIDVEALGLRRARRRRRADPDVPRAAARPGSRRRRRAARTQQPGPARRAHGAPRRADRALRGARRAARRGRAAPPAQQPAAHPRHARTRRCRRSSRRRRS